MKQIKSFAHAFRGLLDAVAEESHLRFHLVSAVYVLLFAAIGKFSGIEWTVLIITVSLVISLELVNTSIEGLCDLYASEKNEKIRRIKDISAGAVLFSAISSVATAYFLFISSGKLLYAFSILHSNPLWFIPLGISAVGAILFVVLPSKNKKNIK